MKVKAAQGVEAGAVEMEGASNVTMRMLIGPADGAPNFNMRMFEVAPGGHTPLHRHDWEHEVYVLDGAGSVRSAKGDHPIAAGDCVFVPPGEQHQFRNAANETLKFLCLVPQK